MNSTIREAKPKALIRCAVAAQLVCVFVFACANRWFSHAKSHLYFSFVFHYQYIFIAGDFCVIDGAKDRSVPAYICLASFMYTNGVVLIKLGYYSFICLSKHLACRDVLVA